MSTRRSAEISCQANPAMPRALISAMNFFGNSPRLMTRPRGGGREQRVGLSGEVERHRIAGSRRHGRAPLPQKFPHLALMLEIANRR
jgi:hypothetical protein